MSIKYWSNNNDISVCFTVKCREYDIAISVALDTFTLCMLFFKFDRVGDFESNFTKSLVQKDFQVNFSLSLYHRSKPQHLFALYMCYKCLDSSH